MTTHEQSDNNSTAIVSYLFDASVAGIILPISDYINSLHVQEYDIVRDASRKRQLEFSTGRFCAKSALTRLGIDNFPVLRNQHREPLWPNDIIGSISHCKDLCGAVAARISDFKAVGFDIENIKALKQDISKVICTPKELKWLRFIRSIYSIRYLAVKL